MLFGGSRNRHHPIFLNENPGKRDLSRRGVLRFRKSCDHVHQRLIRLAGLGRKAGNRVAKIRTVESRSFVDLSREESFAKRAERDETNSQLLKRRKDHLFGFPPPKRVFTL